MKGFGTIVFSRATIGIYSSITRHVLTLNPEFNLRTYFALHVG